MFGGIACLALVHFFPATEASQLPISSIAITGTLGGGVVGAILGWYWAEDFAGEAIFQVLERVIFGAVAAVFKAF